jgi:hypothetical protein
MELHIKQGAKTTVYLGTPLITRLGIAASKSSDKLLQFLNN